MRKFNPVFEAYNNDEITKRVAIVELHFDDTNTDIVYLTSQLGVDLPSGAVAIQGVLISVPVASQVLNPVDFHSTNGSGNYSVLDYESQLTQILRTKDLAGKSLYGKKIVLRAGFEGLPFEYTEITNTHLFESITGGDLSYTINCYDIQYFAKKDNIFDPVHTILTNNVLATDTTFPVSSTTKFEMLHHGMSYSSEQNIKCGYFGLKKGDNFEVVAYTSKTTTSFDDCIRGRFGTVPVDWYGLDSDGNSNELEVFEIIYFEIPVVKALYAVLTDNLYGDTGEHFPSGWTSSIDEQWIDTSSFVNIGTDLWDINDDTKGKVCKFLGLKKTSAKTFIYQQLLPMIGCYLKVNANGELYIDRITEILSTASEDYEIDSSGLVKIDNELLYDHSKILNYLKVNWSYDLIEDDFRRTSAFADSDSITKYNIVKEKEFNLKGMTATRHTRDFISHLFTVMQDQVASEPVECSVTAHPAYNIAECGDVVRLNVPYLEDYRGEGAINRAFEVRSVTVDWLKNPFPTLKLFGSTNKNNSSGLGNPDGNPFGYGIDASVYTIGADASSTYSSEISLSGTLYTLNNNITFTGADNLKLSDGSINPACVFRIPGDFTITTGITLKLEKNVILIIDGFLTVNGKIDGKGGALNGGDYRRTYLTQKGYDIPINAIYTHANVTIYLANYDNAYSQAEPGFIHKDLTAQTGICLHTNFTPDYTRAYFKTQDGYYGYATDPVTGQNAENFISGDTSRRNTINSQATNYTSIPNFDLTANLYGLPDFLIGGGGPQGGNIYVQTSPVTSLTDTIGGAVDITPVAHGSNGGAGGAGLVTITKGLGLGNDGIIDLSGGDSDSDPGSYTNRGETFYAGRGCGGSPGCWLGIFDGADAIPPIVSSSKFIAKYGACTSIGNSSSDQYTSTALISKLAPYIISDFSSGAIPGDNHASYLKSSVDGDVTNYWDSYYRFQFIVSSTPVTPDVTPADNYAPYPLSVNLMQYINVPKTPDGNRVSITVNVVKPSPVENYAYSIIDWQYDGSTGWNTLQTVAEDETVFDIIGDGSTINVRARPVSLTGYAREDGITSQITVSNIGSSSYEFEFGFNESEGTFFRVINSSTSDVVGSLSGTGGYSGKVGIGSGSSGYPNLTDKPTSLAGINSSEAAKLSGIAAGATVNHIYRQSTAPAAGMVEGDIWFDTSDGNHVYVYYSSLWTDAQDAGISSALSAAATAQSTADGKIQSFYQTSAPTSGMSDGDFWIDIDDGNKLYQFQSGAWTNIQDSAIAQAINDAATAQSTADGKVTTFYASSTPTADSDGDLWYNTVTGVVTRWDGSSWTTFSSYNDLGTVTAGNGDLIQNNRGLIKAPDGRPAGILTTAYSASPSVISYSDAANGVYQIYKASSASAAVYPAFLINSGTKYKIRVAVKADAAYSTAFYIRALEYNSDLPSGVTHIGVTPFEVGNESRFVANDAVNTIYGSSALAVATTDTIYEYTYTPGASAKWASIVLTTNGPKVYISLCSVTPIINSDATVNHIYRQATAPTSGMITSDLWYDTSDNNRLYYYNGSSWVDTRDAGIAQALSDASAAQATADGKITSFYQASAPTSGMSEGDIWIDTDDGNKQYRYTSGSWVAVQDNAIATALSDAATAQATADGKVVTFIQTTTPTATGVGDLWYNSSDKTVKRWSGSAWESFATYGSSWTDVSGSGKPADNADVTQDAINAGIVTTGNLELSTGGIIHTAGKTYAGDGNPGVLLGDVSGDNQFYVGDADKKFISYSSGVLEIGEGVAIVGLSNPFNPDIADGRTTISVSDYTITELSSGRITFTVPSGSYSGQVALSNLHSGDGYVVKRGIPYSSSLNLSLANPSWDKKIVWAAAFSPNINATGVSVSAGIGVIPNNGSTSATANGMGFQFFEGKIYGVVGNGTLGTPGTVTFLYLDDQDAAAHRYIFTSDGTSVGFYIDGTLKGTISSSIPTGSNNISDLYRLSVYASTATSGTEYIGIGSWQAWINGS